MSVNLDVQEISKLVIGYDRGPFKDIIEGEMQHRIDLVHAWGGIPEGSRVLELGGGQGLCTAVLATAVGEKGTLTAVDPAPPGYGEPFNIEQTHGFLSATPVGSRITFVEATGEGFLRSLADGDVYDIAVIAHGLWYYSSISVVRETFELLSKHAKRVYVAEWGLAASSLEAVPHVLSALTHGSVGWATLAQSNIRTLLSPSALKGLATETGFELQQEKMVVPNPRVFHWKWEVESVLRDRFLSNLADFDVKDEQKKALTLAFRDATGLAYAKIENKGASMDVFAAVFAPKATSG